MLLEQPSARRNPPRHQLAPGRQDDRFLHNYRFELRVEHRLQVAKAARTRIRNVLEDRSRLRTMHDHHRNPRLKLSNGGCIPLGFLCARPAVTVIVQVVQDGETASPHTLTCPCKLSGASRLLLWAMK